MDGEAESKSAREIKLELARWVFRQGAKIVKTFYTAPEVEVYGGLEKLAALLGLSNQDLPKLRDAIVFFDTTTFQIDLPAIAYKGRLFSVAHLEFLPWRSKQIVFTLHAPMIPEVYGRDRERGDCYAAMEQMLAALTQGLDGVTP